MVLFNGSFNTGTMLGSLALGCLAKNRGYPTMYATATGAALIAAACWYSDGAAPCSGEH